MVIKGTFESLRPCGGSLPPRRGEGEELSKAERVGLTMETRRGLETENSKSSFAGRSLWMLPTEMWLGIAAPLAPDHQ